MEFHIDFGNVVVSAAPSPPVASIAGSAHALGDDRFLFRPHDAVVPARVLPGAALAALDACRAFASRDVQHERIATALRADRSQARGLLDELLRDGLVITAEAWVARVAAAADRKQAPAGPIIIRACDRPAQLAALVATLRESARAHGVAHRYVVVDDSRDPANVAAHARTLADFAREPRVTVTHVDPVDWQRRIDALVAALPRHRDAITFLLARDAASAPRFGGGRGFVFATLFGAGTRFALLDDDFLLPLRRPHNATPGPMRLDAPPDPHTRLHADIEAALADGLAIDGDPFEQQGRACGASLAQLWRDQPALRATPASLDGFAPSIARWLDGDAHVIATANGHRGSSGTASSDWLLLLPRDQRDALTRDVAQYDAQIGGGSVWTGSAHARLVAQGHFTPFVVDGGVMLPPTMPGGRAEDLLFGMLSRALHPRSAVFAPPVTIGHRQEAPRDRAATLRRADTPGLNHFLNDWLGSRIDETRADGPAARCASIAGMLGDLAAASASTQVELVREYLAYRRADFVAQLAETRDAAPDAPAYWQRDVAAAIAANRAALTDDAVPRLAGWDDATDAREIAVRFQREVGGFADALAAWPAIWSHATALAGDAGR